MADRPKSQSKRPYHHGDLRRALVEEAIRIVGEAGVDALTLRAVGGRVGVSRTALYRHFADKAALLGAVALEGFRTLRCDLDAALAAAGRAGGEPLAALAEAYVRFGTAHPAHYRVIFGPGAKGRERDPALVREGHATFAVLVDAIAAGQAAGRLAPADPVRTAQVVWSLVHGLVMLGGDGQFACQSADPNTAASLAGLAAAALLSGLVVRSP